MGLSLGAHGSAHTKFEFQLSQGQDTLTSTTDDKLD